MSRVPGLLSSHAASDSQAIQGRRGSTHRSETFARRPAGRLFVTTRAVTLPESATWTSAMQGSLHGTSRRPSAHRSKGHLVAHGSELPTIRSADTWRPASTTTATTIAVRQCDSFMAGQLHRKIGRQQPVPPFTIAQAESPSRPWLHPSRSCRAARARVQRDDLLSIVRVIVCGRHPVSTWFSQ